MSRTGPLRCAICGVEGDATIETNEWWAGTLHSACAHAACRPCVEGWIALKLEGCYAEGFLQIPCFEHGCRKHLPQKRVLETSRVASQFASDLARSRLVPKYDLRDLVQRPEGAAHRIRCPGCGIGAARLLRGGCYYHEAVCDFCWVREVEAQLPRLRVERRRRCICLHDGACCTGLQQGLWDYLADASGAVRAYQQEVRTELTRVGCQDASEGCLAVIGGAPHHRGPVCPICHEPQWALLTCSPNSEHAACMDCWAAWSVEQFPQCRIARQISVSCFAPGCTEVLQQHTWDLLCKESEPARMLQWEFTRREQLKRNALYPAEMQVDCPRYGCLGLGYLGFDTVMCFLCEHQWSAEDGQPRLELNAEQVEGLEGVVVKKCPRCGEYIEKNGGCDHMTCRCRYEFFWTTLLPYRQ